MRGTIKSICTSEVKGVVKEPIEGAELREDFGIVGDAHAGPGHRQVSLLAAESIARVRAVMPDLADGAFAENLITEGLDLARVKVGEQLRIGRAVLEVTQIGKECHQGCAIREITGDCIMPREGVFCRVLEGGTVLPGDAIELDSE